MKLYSERRALCSRLTRGSTVETYQRHKRQKRRTTSAYVN